MIFIPNATGYELFTSKIHQDPLTGILHGLFMPFACRGFFTIVYGILCLFNQNQKAKLITKNLLWFIVGGMLTAYITFDPYWGMLSLFLYSTWITYSINGFDKNNYNVLYGIIMLCVSLFMMEFVSHWYIEQQASNLQELPNSICQTVLYSTKSLLDWG